MRKLKAESVTKTWSSYDAGYDAGLNGPNDLNCHFGWFMLASNTLEWERGKADGDKERERKGAKT